MARSGSGKILMIGAGVGIAAYMGLLGTDAQRKVRELLTGVRVGLGPSSPLNGGTPLPSGGGSGANRGGRWAARPDTYMGEPNFGTLYDEWMGSGGSGRWADFRLHLQNIGSGPWVTNNIPAPPGWPGG